MKRTFYLLSLVTTVLGSTAGLLAQETGVTALVDRTRIGQNESFRLTVEITGSNASTPELPPMDDFASLRGTSSSQSIQIVNGKMSISKSIEYSFLALETGKFEIGPVKVDIDGKTYESAPIQIEIVSGSAAPQSPGRSQPQQRGSPSQRAEPDQSGSIFLQTEVSKRRVYQNEPVVVTYKIYTQLSITGYSAVSMPSFSGFWVEDFPMPRQPKTYNQVINGQRYLVVEVKRTALFPQAPGNATIEPMNLECEVRVQNRRRTRDLFDSFFDDPFFSRTKRVAINSRPVTIEVVPLPRAGRPADFSGAVGKFSLSEQVDPKRVNTNEAVTIKVTASGTGNIKTLQTPEIDWPPDFEVYDPKSSPPNIEHNNSSISGSRTWEFVVVPRFPGTHTFDPIRLSYFDPSVQRYRTATTNGFTLEVMQGDNQYVAASGVLSKEDVKLLGKDIRFIALAASPFKTIGTQVYTSPWFLLAFILPIFGFAGALLYQQHQNKLSSNVAYARSRKATKLATRQLKHAKKLLSAENTKEFYAEIQRALTGFLGNKLNVAEAGLVTDEIERLMREKSVPEDLIREYVGCLQVCDYQRFAPSNSNGQEMTGFYEQAKKAIESLEDRL